MRDGPDIAGQDMKGGLRREGAVLLRLSLPLIAGQLCTMGGGVVDTMLAGHQSVDTLAAVALGSSLWAVALMAVIGTVMAVQPNIAQRDGAGQRAAVMPWFRQGVLLGVAVGTLAALALVVLGPPLATLMHTPRAIAPMVRHYLYAVAFSLPGFGLLSACRGFSEGLSSTRPSMISGAAGPLLVLPVGAALIYGIGPIPPLRALGSGLTLSLVTWVQALGYLAWVSAPRRAYGGVYRGDGGWRPDRAILSSLLRTGLPIAGTFMMEVGMFSASTLIVGRLGPVPTAAHQIALNAASVMFMIPLGLGLGVTIRVGRLHGAGDVQGARRAGMAGFMLALVTQTASALLLGFGGAIVVRGYTGDAAVAAVAVGLLRLAALFQLFDGTQSVANSALRGLKDTRVPMILAGIAYWAVGIPFGAVLALRYALGASGMWIGMIAALGAAAALLTTRFFRLTGRYGTASCSSARVAASPLR